MYNGGHGWVFALKGQKRLYMFFHTDGCPLGGLCCGQEWSGMDQEWSGKLFLKNSCILPGIPD